MPSVKQNKIVPVTDKMNNWIIMRVGTYTAGAIIDLMQKSLEFPEINS